MGFIGANKKGWSAKPIRSNKLKRAQDRHKATLRELAIDASAASSHSTKSTNDEIL